MISSALSRQAQSCLRTLFTSTKLQRRSALAAAAVATNTNSFHTITSAPIYTINNNSSHAHRSSAHTSQSTTTTTISSSSCFFHTSARTLRPLEEMGRQRFNEAPPLKWNTHLLSNDQIAKVDKIFHKILWLDMVEAHMLTECLKEQWGIQFSAKQTKSLEKFLDAQLLNSEQGSGAGGGDGAEEAAEDAGPQLVELFLTGFDAKSKIKVIKEVRAIAGLGLKEAKELVEAAPKSLQKDLKPEQAEELKAKLEGVGAIVEVK